MVPDYSIDVRQSSGFGGSAGSRFLNHLERSDRMIKIKEALEIPDQLARKPFPTISLELEMSIKAVGSIFLI